MGEQWGEPNGGGRAGTLELGCSHHVVEQAGLHRGEAGHLRWGFGVVGDAVSRWAAPDLPRRSMLPTNLVGEAHGGVLGLGQCGLPRHRAAHALVQRGLPPP